MEAMWHIERKRVWFSRQDDKIWTQVAAQRRRLHFPAATIGENLWPMPTFIRYTTTTPTHAFTRTHTRPCQLEARGRKRAGEREGEHPQPNIWCPFVPKLSVKVTSKLRPVAGRNSLLQISSSLFFRS